MKESYHVRIEKESCVFSAAHFITYDGDVCEPLHGHNYRVMAEVWGELDENHYVVDFVALHDALKKITQRLDHRMLLPTEHPTIQVHEADGEVLVTHGDRRWIFPAGDCVLLPMSNTTAERLAQHIGGLLCAAVEERTGRKPRQVRIGVDECHGQWGTCDLVAD